MSSEDQPAETAPKRDEPGEQAARDIRANATLARISATVHKSGSGDVSHDSDLKMKLTRIIDTRIRAKSTYNNAARCLSRLHQLASNVLAHPTDSKYRSFKVENAKIKAELLSTPGSTDALLELGFRRRVVDFREVWALPEGPLSPKSLRRLQVAEEVLAKKVRDADEQNCRDRSSKKAEEEAEKHRAANAMKEFHEDRQRKKMRDEAERARRAHAAAQESGMAPLSPSSAPRLEPHPVLAPEAEPDLEQESEP